MRMNLSFGSRQLTVDVETSARKRLSITVHPDLRVTAKVPNEHEPASIRKHLEKRASWIARQLDYFERFHPLPTERKFVSGETHYYLGRQYRLKIQLGEIAHVRLIGRFFEMELPDTGNRERAKTLMLKWYSIHAKNLLSRKISKYLPTFMAMGAVVPEVRYRRMRKRWGSCSNGGIIMLNTELVKAPIHCIDYVIIHELCHLVYPSHDKKFYRLLGKILPDWQKRKVSLEKVIIL